MSGVVGCPVCGANIDSGRINDHLDYCLAAQQSPTNPLHKSLPPTSPYGSPLPPQHQQPIQQQQPSPFMPQQQPYPQHPQQQQMYYNNPAPSNGLMYIPAAPSTSTSVYYLSSNSASNSASPQSQPQSQALPQQQQQFAQPTYYPVTPPQQQQQSNPNSQQATYYLMSNGAPFIHTPPLTMNGASPVRQSPASSAQQQMSGPASPYQPYPSAQRTPTVSPQHYQQQQQQQQRAFPQMPMQQMPFQQMQQMQRPMQYPSPMQYPGTVQYQQHPMQQVQQRPPMYRNMMGQGQQPAQHQQQQQQQQQHPVVSSQEYQHFVERYQQMQRLSAQAATASASAKTGWVHMCIVPSKIFTKQWICVQNHALLVYDQAPLLSAKGPKPKARHEIPLESIVTFRYGPATIKITRKQYSFVVQLGDKQKTTYHFASKTREDLDAWVRTIQRGLDNLPRSTASNGGPAHRLRISSSTNPPSSSTDSSVPTPAVPIVPYNKQPPMSPATKALLNDLSVASSDDHGPTEIEKAAGINVHSSEESQGAKVGSPTSVASLPESEGNRSSMFGKLSSTFYGIYNALSADQWSKQDEEWMHELETSVDIEANKKEIYAYMQNMFVIRTHPIGRRVTGLIAYLNKNGTTLHEKQTDSLVPSLNYQLKEFFDVIVAASKSRFPILTKADAYEEACRQALIEVIFNETYAVLFELYKTHHQSEDNAHAERMRILADVAPSDLIDNSQLWLNEEDNSSVNTQKTTPAYEAAIDTLRSLPSMHTPADKLRCLVDTSRMITDCVQAHWMRKGHKKEIVIAADDLLPLLAYVMIKSNIKNIYAEGMFIQDYSTETQKMGMEGYSLATYQAACASLFCFKAKDEMPPSTPEGEPTPSNHTSTIATGEGDLKDVTDLLSDADISDNSSLLPILTPSLNTDFNTHQFPSNNTLTPIVKASTEENLATSATATMSSNSNAPYLISFEDD